jgi:trehalose 6-phosphate synthase/phosphatase
MAGTCACSLTNEDRTGTNIHAGPSVYLYTRLSRVRKCLGVYRVRPSPPPRTINQLHPGRKEILDGMLGANLICFQTYSYTRHFTSTCVRVCGYETTSKGATATSTSASRGASVVPRGAIGTGTGTAGTGTGRTRGTSLTRVGKGTKGGAGVEKYVGIDVQGHVAAVTHCPVGVDAERVARDT